MSDDLSNFKPLDPGRINTDDRVEIRYWCGQLHCSEAALQSALSKVGNHVSAVREHLESSGRAG